MIKVSLAYGQIINPLGAGVFQNFSRNKLNIENWNISHKGNYDMGKNAWQWGLGFDKTSIADKLNEWKHRILPDIPFLLIQSTTIK
ncbi:MAG: hypothetical protein WDO71_09200 [Bacteroidota bacterium]